MNLNALPPQPHPFVSYLRVGQLLYWSLLLFIIESVFYGFKLKTALGESSFFWTAFWAYCFLFSFIHIYLVLMDGWSRYQNYKRAKDWFFMHGFLPKIAEVYVGSKCQRMAAQTAADELGLGDEVRRHYLERGVKWYHYVPYFMIEEPFFLFKKTFWKRTFLEKNYVPKYDYHKMKMEAAL